MQVKAPEIPGKTCSDELSFLSCHTLRTVLARSRRKRSTITPFRFESTIPRTLPHTVNRTLTGTAQPCSLDSGGVCNVIVVTNSEEFCVPE